MSLTLKEYDPVEAKKEMDLEIKKRRKQYPIPLDEKTRKEILRRCQILRILGDDGIGSYYEQSSDQELIDRYSWVLDKEHDRLLKDEFIMVI
jgi:hypothetical protein|tara:strand:+ start:2698 stop:2973 length:276 start_codon:yes stop_codon:yes gene_type:complete